MFVVFQPSPRPPQCRAVPLATSRQTPHSVARATQLPWDSPQDVYDGFGELATTSTTTSTTVTMVIQVYRWNRKNWCAVTTIGRNSAVTRNGPRLLVARSTQPGLDVSLLFCWRSFPFWLLGHVPHTVQLGYNKVLATGKIASFYSSINFYRSFLYRSFPISFGENQNPVRLSNSLLSV